MNDPQRRVAELISLDRHRQLKRPLPPGGEPPYDGGMEARIAKLEAGVEHIQGDLKEIKADIRQVRGDVRTQLYWVLGGFAAVLAVLAKGFGWL